MKKLLLVLVIGASFAACNNNADTKTPVVDSPSTAAIDSSKSAVIDSTKKSDSSAMAPKMVDSTKK
jgi:hypothetical protein